MGFPHKVECSTQLYLREDACEIGEVVQEKALTFLGIKKEFRSIGTLNFSRLV